MQRTESTNPAKSAICVFEIDAKRMGLRLQEIERILPAAELHELDPMPPYFEGFLNYRGTLIPVLNFRWILKMPAKETCAGDRIILARAWSAPVAFIVDEVLGVEDSCQMQVFSSELETLDISSFVEGFIHYDGKLVVIQDLQKFLASTVSDYAKSLRLLDPAESHSP